MAARSEQLPFLPKPPEILTEDAHELQTQTKMLHAGALEFLHALEQDDAFFQLSDKQELYLEILCEVGLTNRVVRELLRQKNTVRGTQVLLRLFEKYWHSLHPEMKAEVAQWCADPVVHSVFQHILNKQPHSSLEEATHKRQLYRIEMLLTHTQGADSKPLSLFLEKQDPKTFDSFTNSFLSLSEHSLPKVGKILGVSLTQADTAHPSWKLWKECLAHVMGELSPVYDEERKVLSPENEAFLLDYLPQHILPASTMLEVNGIEFLLQYDPQSVLWLVQHRPKLMRKTFSHHSALLQLAEKGSDVSQSLRSLLQSPLYADEPDLQVYTALADLKRGEPESALEMSQSLPFGDGVVNSLFLQLIQGGHAAPLAQKLIQELPQLNDDIYLEDCTKALISCLELPLRDELAKALIDHPKFFVLTFPALITHGYSRPVWEKLRANNFRLGATAFEHMLRLMQLCIVFDPRLLDEVLAWSKHLEASDQEMVQDRILGNTQKLQEDIQDSQAIKIDTFLLEWGNTLDVLDDFNQNAHSKPTRFQAFAPPVSVVEKAAENFTDKMEQWYFHLETFWNKRPIHELLFLDRFFTETPYTELPQVRVRQLFRQALCKTGSQADVWNNGVLVHRIQASSAVIWQQLHNEGIPVAPVLKLEQPKPEKARVRSRYCGISLSQFFELSPHWPFQLISEVYRQREAILQTLINKNIDHGHPHTGNFTLEFVRKPYWQKFSQNLNTMPYDATQISFDPLDAVHHPDEWQVVVRLIDWDQAREYPNFTGSSTTQTDSRTSNVEE